MIKSLFDAWLFVANHAKLGKFVAKLEKIYVEIDLFGHDVLARTSTAFRLQKDY